MNIGIDISQIVYEGTGVGRFTHGLVQAILKYDDKNTWTFFFSALRRKLPANIQQQILQSRHKLVQLPFSPKMSAILVNDLRFISTFVMNNYSLLTDLDWFITSDWTEPAVPCKKATIVHDLIFKKYPETVDGLVLKTQEKRLQLVQRESDIIFADSLATKEDLKDIFHIQDKKIVVNYPGVEVNKPNQQELERVKKKYDIKNPFILTVGKIEPRKNIARLVEAFDQLDQSNSIDLYIVGQKGWGNHKPIDNPHIKLMGFVPDEDLYPLYQLSQFFVMPSIYEGFGYPVVEAMQLGVATAIANTSSLTEIGKDATLFFNPIEVTSIKQSLETMMNDETLRKELQQKGLKKSKEFTWQNYYNKLINTLTAN